MHKFTDKPGHYGFIAIEPQYEAKKCIVKEYLLEAIKNRQNVAKFDSEKRRDNRLYQLGQSIGEIADDLIVLKEDLFPISSQVSSIFRMDSFLEKRLD